MVAQMPHIPTEPDSLRNSLSDAMKEALAQVEKVEALPSCFKIASSALLHSCSAMEGSMDHHDNIKRGSDLFVQEEADVYSARLAVCELSGADIIVPNECQAFIPRDSNSRKRTFGGLFGSRGSTKPRELFQFYDEITETNLKQCRKALGTSSQAWTSYSNNRQNAVVMCRAMRSEIEKDETIHVGKVLAGISTAAAESFEEVLRQSQDIKKQFQDLAAAMPKFQQDLVAHDKQRRDALGLFWTEVERAQASMRDLNAELNGAHEGATGITVALHEMVMDSIPELKEALLGASRHVDRVTDAAKAATEISSYAAEFIEHRIVQNAKAIGHDIDAVHAIIPGVHEQIALLVQNILSSQDLLLARQGQALSMQNQTMTNVEDITLMTERARVAIGPVTTALENLGSVIPGGLAAFSKWITTMTRLLISWAVFMLATFGFWERFSGFSKIGSLGLAVGTGLRKCFPTCSQPVYTCSSLTVV